jgi:two-component system chemotaxis sensor kinase CheA
MAPDPYRYFRIEARELVDQLAKTVLELEREGSPEIVARLLRVAHTLKGAARVVKQVEIADRAHALEDALAPFRASTVPVPRAEIDALLRLVDEMSARVTSLGAAPAPQPGSDPVATAPPTSSIGPRSDEAVHALHADVAEMDELLDGVTELHAQLMPARRALGGVERARRLAELIADQLAAPRAFDQGRPAAEAEKVRSMAEELGTLLVGVERSLSSGVEQIDREMTQVRRAAEQMRLTPARAIFGALERTARDAAQAVGKSVVLETRGGEVRLDAQMLAGVQGALVQVVRNAVAHGIEAPDQRDAAGKARAGRILIEVARRGRYIVFAGHDDGRGVDLEAVRAVAQKRGLLPTEARALGTEELVGLLLRGGLTTSAAVTEVSGRGVGLDVVRETAERFGGEVIVRTKPGEGTRVELVVPASVASMLALTVEAVGVSATIPLDAVVATLRIRATDVTRSAEGETVVHEGVAIPFLALARVLGPRRVAPSAHEVRSWSAVVIRGAGELAVIGVDRLLGTANIVLRPLPDLAPGAAVIAGASLDAEGSPQLVLDPDALVVAARQRVMVEREVERTPAPILVIDDSLTTRMLERSILESAGYEVDVATSGEEGLEKARGKRYSLFLVDIEMPGIDGFTFVERTRADALLRDIPAILVSSRSSPEDRRRGEEVGALAYMVKSEFDQGALLGRIREQVG